MNEFIEFIDAWLGGHYPRGLGNPARGNVTTGYHIARDAIDVHTFCSQNRFTTCYHTTYAFTKYDDPATDAHNAIVDTIPFDFDSTNLQASLNDAKTLVSWCRRHDIVPRITFSGGKGFHVFVDIKPVILKYPKRTLSKFCTELSDAAGFTTVDRVIFGDLNRLIRIPNTMHAKSGMYCVALNADTFNDMSLDQILTMARTPQYEKITKVNNKNSDIISILLDIDANMPPEADFRMSANKESKLAKIFTHAPIGRCRAVDMLMSYGTDEGSRDLALTGIIRYYSMLGFDKSEVLNKCITFDSKCERPMRRANITYKVNYHMKKEYSYCTFLCKIGGICNGCKKFS